MSGSDAPELRELLWEWVAWEEGTTNAVPVCMFQGRGIYGGGSLCWTGPIHTDRMLKRRVDKLKNKLCELEKHCEE